MTYHELTDAVRARRNPLKDGEEGARILLTSRGDLLFWFDESDGREMRTIYTLTSLGRRVAAILRDRAIAAETKP